MNKISICRFLNIVAISLACLSIPQYVNAGPITYTVNDTFGAGSVSGTITTDGALGTLVLADILDWDLILSDGTNTVNLLQGVNGGSVNLEGGALTATSMNLIFNYSYPSFSDFYIYNATAIPALFGELCYTSSSNCWGPAGVGAYNVGGDNLSIYQARSGSQIIASVVNVPEPETYTMLLAGLGFLGFMARRNKQKPTA